MHAALAVGEEGALEMDADGSGFVLASWGFDRRSEGFERAERGIDRGGNGGGEEVRNAASGKKALELRQLGWSGPHDVVTHGAVGVDVEEGGGESGGFAMEGFWVGIDLADRAVGGEREDGELYCPYVGDEVTGRDGVVQVLCTPSPLFCGKVFKALDLGVDVDCKVFILNGDSKAIVM